MSRPEKTYRIAGLSLFALVLLILAAHYLIFMVVPNERTMGAVQRILYFHVGSAFACYICAAVVLFGGLNYLATRSTAADACAQAGGEVGFLFCSITLITGMIWAHSAWNTWFRWEPRLVTFLLLWFVFLALNLLRVFGDRERIPAHSAVLGIIGAITVPLVVFSVNFLPGVPQLHPKNVVVGGLEHWAYKLTFWLSVAAMIALQSFLVWFRYRIGLVERKLESGV